MATGAQLVLMHLLQTAHNLVGAGRNPLLLSLWLHYALDDAHAQYPRNKANSWWESSAHSADWSTRGVERR